MDAVLRIAYDATPLLGARTGVGVMTARVLERLAARDDVHVTVYATTWRGQRRLRGAAPIGVRVVDRRLPARAVHLAWRKLGVPRVEAFAGPVDVVHGPNFVVPPARRAGRVATVHDLTAVHHPELCTPHARTYAEVIGKAVADGAWIHTVSDFVRGEVIEVFDADPGRVVTVPNGVDPIPDVEPAVGHRMAGGDHYVLTLGTIEPRKNYPGLLRAFDALAAEDPDLRLVVVGPDGWGSAEFEQTRAACAHRDRIVRLGMTDELGRAALLHGAAALAYPSVYEGFGLPPLEAMAAGVPVVVTSAGAVLEVVGDAALVVPVGDDDALAEGLGRVLADDVLRRTLVARGREQVRHYSWDATAGALVALYRRAAVGSA